MLLVSPFSFFYLTILCNLFNGICPTLLIFTATILVLRTIWNNLALTTEILSLHLQLLVPLIIIIWITPLLYILSGIWINIFVRNMLMIAFWLFDLTTFEIIWLTWHMIQCTLHWLRHKWVRLLKLFLIPRVTLSLRILRLFI